MPDNLAQYSRVITNLYTAVFERQPKKSNIPRRYASTVKESISLTDEMFAIDWVPVARYYAPLAIEGSYVQATGIVSGIVVPYPVADLSSEQGWFACRIEPDWAYDPAPGADKYIMHWADDGSNRLMLRFNNATQEWLFDRSATSADNVVVAADHAADDPVTLIIMWDATTIYISLDGANFVTSANALIPTLAATTLFIGSSSGETAQADAVFRWVVIGDGVLTNTDAADFAALGNEILAWDEVPGYIDAMPRFIWNGVDAEHVPTALYGEAIYSA